MKLRLLIFGLSIFLVSCYNDDDYLPSNTDYSHFLQLSASDTVLIADGESHVEITGELPIDMRDDKTTIIFTTDKGSFENGQKTISKAATIQSVNGVNKRAAVVNLASSTKIETATIEANIGDQSRYIKVYFTPIDVSSLFNVGIPADHIPADGISFALITVNQPIDIKDDYASVTLTTNTGVFENGQKSITKTSAILFENNVYTRKAQFKLTSPNKVDSADVEIAVKGTDKHTVIYFSNAFPDTLILSASSLSITPGFDNSLTLTTTLKRVVGTPSLDNMATLQVLDTLDHAIGYFLNYSTTCDGNGIITNKFSLGDNDYVGKLKAVAMTVNENGVSIPAILEIISTK